MSQALKNLIVATAAGLITKQDLEHLAAQLPKAEDMPRDIEPALNLSLHQTP